MKGKRASTTRPSRGKPKPVKASNKNKKPIKAVSRVPISFSEKGFRALIEHSVEAITLLDDTGKVIYDSPAANGMLGYGPEDWIGRSVFELIHADDLQNIQDVFQKLVTTPGGDVKSMFRVQHKDNSWLWIEAVGTNMLAEEDVKAVVVNYRDITERKQAEQQLNESEERFSKAFYQNPVGIVLTDLSNNTIRDVNDALLKIVGLAREHIVGKDALQLGIQVDPEARAAISRELQERGSFQSKEVQLHLPNGEIRHILDSGVLITVSGRPHHLGLLLDITDRKQAEEKIQLQVRQLSALHEIDQAINASVDLRVTLDVFLKQAVSQLNVDAAAILLFNPTTLTLQYAAGRGFPVVRHTQVRLDESYAGRAVLERKTIRVPNFLQTDNKLPQFQMLIDERFVDYYAIPLMAKGQVKGVLEIFHRAQLTLQVEWLDFLETLAGQAAIAIDNTQLFDDLQRSNVSLTMAYDATIEGWSAALDLRDKETEGHSRRVTETTVELARIMGIGESELVHVRRGALLHDMGKLGVPDHILLKPDKLSGEEWEIMQKHPLHAYEMLLPINYLRPALDIPYAHHEKWDGSGYPRGLKGGEIPLAARIFAIVDVWDAVTSDRPYRPAWSKEEAMEFIKNESGKHFDPQIVEEFLRMIADK